MFGAIYNCLLKVDRRDQLPGSWRSVESGGLELIFQYQSDDSDKVLAQARSIEADCTAFNSYCIE